MKYAFWYLISILAEEKRAAEVAVKKSKKDGIWGLLLNGTSSQDEAEEGGVDFSLGNVLRIMLFTKKKDNGHERHQLIRIAESLDTLAKRLDHIGNILCKFLISLKSFKVNEGYTPGKGCVTMTKNAKKWDAKNRLYLC